MFTADITTPEKKQCVNCEALIESNCKYCSICGKNQLTLNAYHFENRWRLLQQAGLFYGIDIIVCCLASFIEYFRTLSWLLIIDVLMAFSAVVFFCLNWIENKELLIWKNFSLKKLIGYTSIAVIGSCLVHYSVGWLNIVIYNKDEHYFELLKGNFFGVFILIFFTAVMPALFEEFGYRGYLLSNLLKVVDDEQAVYISSFLFAIIHMSFVSLFWLIPFALFLGFIRLKENTMWYGVFVHFSFNLTACLFELL